MAENLCPPETSKQLLYSERFSDNLEEKLKVVGKKKQDVPPKKTFRPPPSSVLSQVRGFLPQLALANEKLRTLPPSDVNIEETDEHDGPLIEMSLALVPGVPSDVEDSSEEDEEDSSADSEDSCAETTSDTVTLSVSKKTKHKASIEVLPDKNTAHVLDVPDG